MKHEEYMKLLSKAKDFLESIGWTGKEVLRGKRYRSKK